MSVWENCLERPEVASYLDSVLVLDYSVEFVFCSQEKSGKGGNAGLIT